MCSHLCDISVVSANHLSDKVAKAFAETLKENRTLTYLDLSHNDFGELGGLFLGAGLVSCCSVFVIRNIVILYGLRPIHTMRLVVITKTCMYVCSHGATRFFDPLICVHTCSTIWVRLHHSLEMRISLRQMNYQFY